MNFSEKVWEACRLVPRGKVTTYKEIARKLGTNAYRAVGNSLNANPYAPLVPCHRVVNSSGAVGGFASGSGRKEKILRSEGVLVRNGRVVDFEKKLHRF